MFPQILQPLTQVPELSSDGAGSIHYLPVTRATVLWGRLPCARDVGVLTVDSGDEVTIDTISHEGVLEDQGRDPAAFFGRHGVPREFVLDDAIDLAASDFGRDPGSDGPHVVTGPIHARGARSGDLLKMTVLEATPRVPYGVISNRHGRDALPGEYPRGTENVTVFAAVEEFEGIQVGTLPLVPGGDRVVRFPLHQFLGIMGVAVTGAVRAHSVPRGAHGGNIDINLLTVGSALCPPVQVAGALAYAYLSTATDFNISQVVDRVTGVHARIRTADFRG